MENVIFIGENEIDKDAIIKPFSIIKNSVILAGAIVGEHSYIENSKICKSSIGRNNIIVNSVIKDNCLLNDFCKIENSTLDLECKLNDFCSVISKENEKIFLGKNVTLDYYVKVETNVSDFTIVKQNRTTTFYKC